MNPRWEEVPCPCPWCRAGDRNSLHRVRRMLFDDKPLSPEAKRLLDEIVQRAVRGVPRTTPEGA
jgi:hypothetical protein